MMDLNDLNRCWKFSALPKVTFHSIDAPEMAALRDACRNVYFRLPESEKGLRAMVWRLSVSATSTLMPFSAPELGLEKVVHELEERIGKNGRDWVDSLKNTLGQLFQIQENPKKQLLDDIFLECSSEISLWNRPQNKPPEGWPEDLCAWLYKDYGDKVRVVNGFRELQNGCDVLVLTSPLDSRVFDLSIALRVLGRGRTEAAHILRYACEPEGITDFSMSAMPYGITFTSLATPWETVRKFHPEGTLRRADTYSTHVEDWGEDAAAPIDDESEEPVPAVRIDFTSGQFAYFGCSSKVHRLNDGGDVKICAEELTSRDRLVLIKGNGDAGAFVLHADRILEARGLDRVGLLASIRIWKQTIQTCVNHHGVAKVFREMERAGEAPSDQGRIEAWAGPEVMAPQNWSSFLALMQAVQNLGFFRDVENMESHARVCWRDVQGLRNANRLGGREAADDLSELLEKWIGNHADKRVGDELSLGQGEMTGVIVEVEQVRFAGRLSRSRFGRLS